MSDGLFKSRSRVWSLHIHGESSIGILADCVGFITNIENSFMHSWYLVGMYFCITAGLANDLSNTIHNLSNNVIITSIVLKGLSASITFD